MVINKGTHLLPHSTRMPPSQLLDNRHPFAIYDYDLAHNATRKTQERHKSQHALSRSHFEKLHTRHDGKENEKDN
jgi:hypothetical protein